jgi:osmoprotectant transport system ATP-binding protein
LSVTVESSTRPPAISLRSVTKVFDGGDVPAVRDLSLDVPQGSVMALVGPSGCGKTTTLRMINRLVEPTSGTILLMGTDVSRTPTHQLRRGIGYVIQQTGLFPHQTVATNIGTVPRLLGWKARDVAARVGELVDLVGLDRSLLARYPSELSGGQQQRVGVARALAADPPVLLMDEPYSAVDPIVRERLQDELLALQAKVGKTIVFVTHDIDEAIKLADRIALLNVGGVLEQTGTPEELLRGPANEFVAAFLGRERGLKRLALLTVGDLAPQPGAVVPPEASVAEAKEAMARHGVDWVGVVDGTRLLGWAWGADLAGAASAGEAPLHPFRTAVSPATPLREALDAIVLSRTQVAAVVDDGVYLGMLDLGHLAEALR